MWYDALEVARYIISRCTQLDKPISNLKLQKMIYFVWVDFYKKTRRKLFLDDICAWQLGPVVPTVYYEYCSYAGRPISAVYSVEIEEKDTTILDEIINQYIDVSPNTLVNRTHALGTAWSEIYAGGKGNRKVIPFSLILDKEVG